MTDDLRPPPYRPREPYRTPEPPPEGTPGQQDLSLLRQLVRMAVTAVIAMGAVLLLIRSDGGGRLAGGDGLLTLVVIITAFALPGLRKRLYWFSRYYWFGPHWWF